MSQPTNGCNARLQELVEQYEAAAIDAIDICFSTKLSSQSSQTGTQQPQAPSIKEIFENLRVTLDAWWECYEETKVHRQVPEEPDKKPSVEPTDNAVNDEVSENNQTEKLPEMIDRPTLQGDNTEERSSERSVSCGNAEEMQPVVDPNFNNPEIRCSTALDHLADMVNEHSEGNPCPGVTDEQAKLDRPSLMACDHTQKDRCTYVHPQKNLPNDAPMSCSEDNNISALTSHVEDICCSELLAVTAGGTSRPTFMEEDKRLVIHKPPLDFPHQNNGIPRSDTTAGLKPTPADDWESAMLLNKPTFSLKTIIKLKAADSWIEAYGSDYNTTTSLSVYNAEDDKANSTKADDTSFRSNRTTLSLNVHPQNWSGRGEKNQRIKYNYDYIYQSTLSRLPVRLSNIRPRSHSVQGFESSRYSMRIPESHPIQTTQKNLTLSGCPVVIIDIVSNQETSESNIEIPRNNKTIPQLPGEIQKNQIKIGIVGKTANITSEMGRKNMTACKTVPDYRRSRSADSWESLNSPYKVHALPLHKQRASKIYPRPGSFELKDNLGPDMMESTSVSHPLPPLAIPTQAHKSTKSRQPQRVEQAAQRVQRGESLPVRESDMEKPKLPPQVLPEDYEWLGTLDRRSQPATYFDGLKQFQTVEPLPSVPARLVPVSPGISQKSAEQFERERQKIPAIDHKESFVRRPNRPQSTPAFRTSSGTDESPLPSPPPTPPEYRDYTRPHSSPDRFINKTREEDMRTPKNLRQKQWIQIRSHSELEARQVNVGVADSYRSVELPVMIDMLRDKKRNNQSSDRHLEDKNKSHLMPSDSVSRPVSGDFKPGSRQRQSSRFLESSDLERLLAPDPYRKKSKDSNGSVEPGQPVTFESSSRPPMVKMKTVDINAPPIPTRHPTANGGSIKPVDNISSKPKNIRKRPVQRSKSDMDKYLDGKIEKAYSEEIVRRASVKSEGDADKRNGSISSLSELAEYEEQVSKQWERFRDKFRALSRKGLRDHSVPSENVDLKGQTPSDGPPTDTSVREPPHHITTDPPQPSELRKAERGTRESRTSKLPVPIDSWKSPAGSGFVRVITDDAKHSKNEFKRPDRSGDDKCKSTAPTRPQKRYSVRGQPVPLKTELVRQDKNISAGKDRHPPSGSETTEDGKDYHLGYADSQVRDQHHPKSVKGMPSGGTESPRPKSIGHPSSDGGKQIHGVRPSPRHGEEKARYYPDSGEDGVGKAKIAKSPEPIYSQSGSGNVPENKGETVPGAPGGKGKKAFDSDRPSPRSDQMAEEAAPLTPQRLIKRPADQNRRRESGGPERLVPPKLASEENKTERVKPGRLPFDGSQTHRRAEGCSPLTDRHPPKSVEYETSEQGKPTFRSARGSKNREQLPTKTVDDEKTRKPESGLPDKADDGRFRSAASTRSSHGDLAPSRAIASRSRYSPEGRARSKPEKPLSETGRHKIHEPTVAENVKSPHDPTATSTDVSGLKQGDTGSERKPFISRIGGYIRDHTHMFDKLPQRKHQKDREENEQFNDSAANDSVKVSSTSPPPFKPISDRRHPQKRRLYEEIDVNQDQKIKRPSSMEPGNMLFLLALLFNPIFHHLQSGGFAYAC
ncbi:unnamed protein product [Calicophoron daubneyi]|uniref:SoHo domain-containing protein n=1 Tax=Calicophoron daubneyi TaxID=300641 RepID=A0AAV2SZG1_CALDB